MPHGVLKEPSKRRRCHWNAGLVFPRESNSGMVPTTGITPNDVSSNEASKYSNGVSASTGTASHLRKPKPSRRCRECVHEVDNVSEDKSSVRQRIRTKTDRTATSSLPSWAVCGPMMDRARGARGPLTLRLAGTPERRNERNTNNRQAILFYWWVPTDRPNLRLGSRKGTYCPKWEV